MTHLARYHRCKVEKKHGEGKVFEPVGLCCRGRGAGVVFRRTSRNFPDTHQRGLGARPGS